MFIELATTEMDLESTAEALLTLLESLRQFRGYGLDRHDQRGNRTPESLPPRPAGND